MTGFVGGRDFLAMTGGNEAALAIEAGPGRAMDRPAGASTQATPEERDLFHPLMVAKIATPKFLCAVNTIDLGEGCDF